MAAAAAALAAAVAPTAQAMQLGVSAQGVPYLSGGAEPDGRQILEQLRSRYGVWLITRNRETDQPLSGVHVRVIDDHARQVVFDQTLNGPWLLLSLPAGAYRIEARFDGELRRWTVQAHGDDAQPQVLYFDALA